MSNPSFLRKDVDIENTYGLKKKKKNKKHVKEEKSNSKLIDDQSRDAMSETDHYHSQVKRQNLVQLFLDT